MHFSWTRTTQTKTQMFDPNVGIKDAPSSDCGDGAKRCEQKSREGMGVRQRRSPPSAPVPLYLPPFLPLSDFAPRSNMWTPGKSDANYKSCVRVVAFATALVSLVWTSPYFPLLYPPRSPLRLTLIFVIFALPHRSHIYSLKRNKPTIQKLGLLCISGRI